MDVCNCKEFFVVSYGPDKRLQTEGKYELDTYCSKCKEAHTVTLTIESIQKD
jgi:hypothetical protein